MAEKYNKEQYNLDQEKIVEHNPLWMLEKWFKVPFGGNMKLKMIPYYKPFSRIRKAYIKADSTKERGWWNR